MNYIFLGEYTYIKSMKHSKHLINTRYNNARYLGIILFLLDFIIFQLSSIPGKKKISFVGL